MLGFADEDLAIEPVSLSQIACAMTARCLKKELLHILGWFLRIQEIDQSQLRREFRNQEAIPCRNPHEITFLSRVLMPEYDGLGGARAR